MQSNNNKSFWETFAITFAALFGLGMGVSKIIKTATSNPEVEKLRNAVDQFFIEGVDEAAILTVLMTDFTDKMGKEPTEEQKNMVRRYVSEEKAKLQREGKI
ncbi:MAG: hypothetical protein M1334_04505 [Patescibacteria group bacterium]|nr:hypothetical protein [Patescibacteria group bacterium]